MCSYILISLSLQIIFMIIPQGEKHLSCIVKTCEFVGHISCYAQHFLSSEKNDNHQLFLIPVTGKCPGCKQELLWGDLLRQRQYALQEDLADGNNEEDKSEDEDEEMMSQQNYDDADYGDDEDDFQ